MLFCLIWVYVAELSIYVSCLAGFDWWGGPQFSNKGLLVVKDDGGRARARHRLVLLMQVVVV